MTKAEKKQKIMAILEKVAAANGTPWNSKERSSMDAAVECGIEIYEVLQEKTDA